MVKDESGWKFPFWNYFFFYDSVIRYKNVGIHYSKLRVVKEKTDRKSPFRIYFSCDSLVCYNMVKQLIIIYIQFKNATIYTVKVFFFNFTSNFICSPVSNSNITVWFNRYDGSIEYWNGTFNKQNCAWNMCTGKVRSEFEEQIRPYKCTKS